MNFQHILSCSRECLSGFATVAALSAVAVAVSAVCAVAAEEDEDSSTPSYLRRNSGGDGSGSGSSSSSDEKIRTAFREQARDAVIANVDGEIIMLGDLRRETLRYISELRRASSSQRDFQEKLQTLTNDTVRNLTETRLLVSAFDDSGAMMDDNYIEQRINDIIDSEYDGDRSKYLQMLRQTGSNPLADKRRMRDRIKAMSWNEHIVQPAYGDVSPSKVRAEYESRIEEFRTEAMVEYAQIVLFAGASETDEQVEAQAKRVHDQIAEGETEFETAAKIFSRDDYRANGGYVGWKPLSDLSEQIIPALERTPEGGVSELITLDAPSGKVFVLLKKIAAREAGVTPLKDVRAQLENRMRTERAQQLRAEKMAELRDDYYVHYF